MRLISFALAFALALSSIAWPAWCDSATSDLYKERTTLSSLDLQLIELSKREVRERRPSWKIYQISVVETDSTFEISFWRQEDIAKTAFVVPSKNGAPEKVLGTQEHAHNSLVVEVDKKTLRITRVVNGK